MPNSGGESGPTVADLTEQDLVASIQAHLPPAPAWMPVGIGDDAAVVEPERGRLEVLSVDALVEGVHFDWRFTPADAIGHRALAVNLSDLAAMGASPRLALLSFALPPSLTCCALDQMLTGLASLASIYNVHVAGGNLTRSPGPLMIDLTIVGTVKRRHTLTRHGARAADDVYVTGTIGAAAAGLQKLQASLASGFPATGDLDTCVRRYLYPEPRIRAGVLLGRNKAASACIDLSDGLADGLQQIARASGIGIAVDGDLVPVDAAARAWFESRGGDGVWQALVGGDDYELLFTGHPRHRGRLKAVARHGGCALTRIGVCTREDAVVLRERAGGDNRIRPVPSGYSHFR